MSRRPLGCLFEIAETLALTIIIFLLIQNFVAQPYRVEQESMSDTLEQGQYVLVDKLTPRFDDYSRGDIVVFHPPGSRDSEVPFIKRVIGVPGDHIQLSGGRVVVNGETLDEPYTDGQDTDPESDETEWVIAPSELFVMGDNRANSRDSRSDTIGPVPSSSVIGRAWLRYWPITALSILETPRYPTVPPASSTATPAPS